MNTLRIILMLFFCAAGKLAFEAEAQLVAVQHEEGNLVTREFKVNMASINQGLDRVGGGSSTNLQERLIQLFRAAGINIPTNGNYVMLNTSTGALKVKATKEDLETVQVALDVLDFEPLQVMLEVRQFEVGHIEKDERLDMEVLLKSFAGEMTIATNVTWLDESLKASLFTNKNVTVEGLFKPNHVRVLPPQELKLVLRALDQRDGADMMTQPRTSTLNGRTVRAGMVCDLAQGVFLGSSSDGGFPRLEDMVLPAGVFISPQVRPLVDASGTHVQMDWVADVIQIVNHKSQPASVASLTPLDAPVPDYRVRQVTGSSMIKDGETLMIGCGMVEKLIKGRDGAPDQKQRIVTIFMLTPTVVDAQGNEVNRKEK